VAQTEDATMSDAKFLLQRELASSLRPIWRWRLSVLKRFFCSPWLAGSPRAMAVGIAY